MADRGRRCFSMFCLFCALPVSSASFHLPAFRSGRAVGRGSMGGRFTGMFDLLLSLCVPVCAGVCARASRRLDDRARIPKGPKRPCERLSLERLTGLGQGLGQGEGAAGLWAGAAAAATRSLAWGVPHDIEFDRGRVLCRRPFWT